MGDVAQAAGARAAVHGGRAFGRAERALVLALALALLGLVAALAASVESGGVRGTLTYAVLAIVAALALGALVLSRVFVVRTSPDGVRLQDAFGNREIAWSEIERFEVGPGWLAQFRRVFLVLRDGSAIPLRPIERRAAHPAAVEAFCAELQRELGGGR